MRFFNIHYECNDTGDDYFKLLKQQNSTDGVFPHWFKSDDNDNFDGDNYDDGGDFTVHEGAHSVKICVRYIDNTMTLCCLRRPSRCPADCT